MIIFTFQHLLLAAMECSLCIGKKGGGRLVGCLDATEVSLRIGTRIGEHSLRLGRNVFRKSSLRWWVLKLKVLQRVGALAEEASIGKVLTCCVGCWNFCEENGCVAWMFLRSNDFLNSAT